MHTVQIDNQSVSPSKIICIGRNYVDHIKELNNEVPNQPVIFLKPNSAISKTIILPPQSCRYEAEICFLVRNNQIYGVGFGLDLTLGELQKELKAKGLPWEKAKAFNGSAVFSRFIRFDGEYSSLALELKINDTIVQKASTELMIFKPEKIFSEIQKYFCIYDDDIVMTGTPKGVGIIKKGDRYTGSIYYRDEKIISEQWEIEAHE